MVWGTCLSIRVQDSGSFTQYRATFSKSGGEPQKPVEASAGHCVKREPQRS